MSLPPATSEHPRHNVLFWLAWTIAIISIAMSIGRLVLRPGYRVGDYALHHSASRAWQDGRDPYDRAYVAGWWREHGATDYFGDLSRFPLLAMPATLAVMSPLAALRPRAGWWIWLTLVIVLAGLAIRAAIFAAGIDPASARAAWAIAIGAAFGPILSGVGNPGVPAACLMIIAVALTLSGGRDVAAGVLLGVASCLKLQLALPLAIYFLVCRRRWRIGIWSLVIPIALSAISIARMELTAPTWRASWREAVSASHAPGGPTDFTPANKTRDHLVNVESVLLAITGSRTLSLRTGPLITAALGATLWALVSMRRNDELQRDVEFAGACVAVGLCAMPFYHRYYDATPMLLVVAWAVSRVGPGRTIRPWLVLALLLLYLGPVGWQSTLVRRGLLPMSIEDSGFWRVVMQPLVAWVLLAVTIIMLGVLAHGHRAVSKENSC